MARTNKKAAAESETSGPNKTATAAPKKTARKKSAKKARKYRRYSDAERSRILATARREKLTGAQVQKRFGVTTVTYYSWRKRAGTKGGPGRPKGAVSKGSGGSALDGQLRSEVQARIRELLPDLVRAEVNSFLASALGPRGGRSRRGSSQ